MALLWLKVKYQQFHRVQPSMKLLLVISCEYELVSLG